MHVEKAGQRVPFLDEATLQLNADDGATVYYTSDGSDRKDDGTPYDGALRITNSVVIRARATRDGRWSTEIACEVAESTPLVPDTERADRYTYDYYEGHTFDIQPAVRDWGGAQGPDFEPLTPVDTGVVDTPTLDISRRDDTFGVVFEGTLSFPERGMYGFTLAPDGRGRLTIGESVLKTSGIGENRDSKALKQPLQAGTYALRIEYVNPAGETALSVTWNGPSVDSEPFIDLSDG